MAKEKVVIIGAGPGGLTAGMILSHRGYDVEIFETKDTVGGRNAPIKMGDFTFDTGPTFLMMKDVLEEMFELSGKKAEDYLDIREVDPMYRLRYADGREFFPSHKNRDWMIGQIETLFPGNGVGYLKFLKREQEKYDRLIPCLKVPYDNWSKMFSKNLRHALPYLDAHISLYRNLGRYFDDDDLKIAFTFQAKYLGMSPWECPASFAIISLIEHNGGIWHPIGGLNTISKAMAKVIEENGGKIHLSTTVKELFTENGKANGIWLESGDIVQADRTIINADFAHAMHNIAKEKDLKNWKPAKVRSKRFSCSTFMLYLAVDKLYDIPHHTICFAEDYKKNVAEMAESMVLSEDPSVYIQNACRTDNTLAPEGKSTIYILVPVPNTTADIDWDAEKDRFREIVLDRVEKRGGLTDIRDHIIEEKMITPDDWRDEHNVFNGATFNLAHNVAQMLVFRPHNRFEDIDNCYLVGGGTHPGSGLPTIYESGRITADIISGKYEK